MNADECNGKIELGEQCSRCTEHAKTRDDGREKQKSSQRGHCFGADNYKNTHKQKTNPGRDHERRERVNVFVCIIEENKRERDSENHHVCNKIGKQNEQGPLVLDHIVLCNGGRKRRNFGIFTKGYSVVVGSDGHWLVGNRLRQFEIWNAVRGFQQAGSFRVHFYTRVVVIIIIIVLTDGSTHSNSSLRTTAFFEYPLFSATCHSDSKFKKNRRKK